MDIKIDDKYVQRGYPPVLTEMDNTTERIWGIISLYKSLIEVVNVVKQIDPSWEDEIEHIFFGENEVMPDENKAVHLSDDLKDFINTTTKYQTLAEVTLAVQNALTSANGYTDQKILDLINGAPAALDTLKELADKLKDEEDAIAVIVNTLTNINRKIGTLPEVHDAGMYSSDGETSMGICVVGEVQAWTSPYNEIMLIESNISGGSYHAGTLLYIRNDAVFDGETLIPVYNADLEPLNVSLKISPARTGSVAENLDWTYLTLEKIIVNSVDTLNTTLRQWANDTFVSKASQQYSKLKVVANNGTQDDTFVNFVKGTYVTINANSLPFSIKVPATYNAPTVWMSGLPVPMTTGTDETIDGVVYHVYTSANTYSNSISVQII